MKPVVRPILLAVFLGIPQPASAQGNRTTIPGCYDVEVGTFTPALGDHPDSLFYAPPSRVFFDSVLVGRERGWDEGYLALRVATGALPSIHERAGWKAEGDSVHLAWSDYVGSGLRAVVRKVPEGLAGEARTFMDYESAETRAAPITLRRVPCDSPPTVTEEDQRLLLTAMSFTDGTRVALDESIQPGNEWEEKTYERYSTLVRFGPTIEIFGPAESVEVFTRQDGFVTRIDLHFFPTDDFETAARKVMGEIGEPMMRSNRTREGVRTQALHWMNRTHRVQLRGTQTDGGPWNIILYLDMPRPSGR